ncbi:uncharacterized protein Cpr72Ea [Eurosta solidaginis]|uniref:uncharacterized protein Cpr72Ea n=1 Tax=Eurosta solidaginis TaxID=178769 RepID=UPI003530C425
MRLALLVFGFGVLIATSCVEATPIAYLATPLLRSYPYVYSAHSSSLVTPNQLQYHTQDGLGHYAYGYAEPHSAKQETRSLDGITRGTYSYLDPAGKLQVVDYTADDDGFHVAATNLPHDKAGVKTQQPLQEATEQQEQQQQQELQQPFRGTATSVGDSIATDVATTSDNRHTSNPETLLRFYARRESGSESSATSSIIGSVQLPQPVADTIAVAAAKAEYLKRNEQETKLHELAQQGHHVVPTVVSTAIPRAVIPSIYRYGYPWRYYYY